MLYDRQGGESVVVGLSVSIVNGRELKISAPLLSAPPFAYRALEMDAILMLANCLGLLVAPARLG